MAQTVLFGRYRLREAVGAGGSAEVWRALDTKTGEEVAVKRLHPLVVADAAARRRLHREFRALRALDEPHVVRVRDLRISRRDAALILDFIDGRSLADRLADETPLEPAEAQAIVDDVAAALAAAHAAGIVHRDVTPGNILLPTAGGARLTDFGIARDSRDGAATTTGPAAMTAVGFVMGTMRYLAPEQLRGEPATPSSDLHALAAVTWEMLAGRPAYDVPTPVALAEAQSAGPPALLGVPAGVDAVVRRALATDPADRPRAATAFATALRAAFDDAPTDAIALPADARTRTLALPVPAAVSVPGAVSQARVAPVPRVVPPPSAALASADQGGSGDPGESAGPAAALAVASASARRAALGIRRRVARVPGPLAVLVGLAAAGIVLGALAPADPRPSDPVEPVVAATPAATAVPTEPPADEADEEGGEERDKDKGKGRDDDDHPGKGKGRDDD